MKKLFHNKAFTLVEVVTGMAITAVLMVAVMAIFVPVQNLVKTISNQTAMDTVKSIYTSYIEAQLTGANGLGMFVDAEVNEDGTIESDDVKNYIDDFESKKSNGKYDSFGVLTIAYDSTDKRYRLYDTPIDPTTTGWSSQEFAVESNRVFNDEFYESWNIGVCDKTESTRIRFNGTDLSDSTRCFTKMTFYMYDNETGNIEADFNSFFEFVNFCPSLVAGDGGFFNFQNAGNIDAHPAFVVVYASKKY